MHACVECGNTEMEGLYEVDFVEWVAEQVSLLRSRDFERLDLDNLIEELDAMARHDKRELRSRLIVITAHLLKCQYQPGRKGASWIETLCLQRGDLHLLLDDSPSLRRLAEEFAQSGYAKAVRKAARETGNAPKRFPAELPYTVEQLLDEDFIP